MALCASMKEGDRQVKVSASSVEDLRFLAGKICALNIPEGKMVHAETMMQSKAGEYSLAFYEAAIKIIFCLKALACDLEKAVITNAEVVPCVAEIPFSLQWGSAFSVTKQQLLDYANKIRNKKDLKGPDANLARRILSKKATGEEWRHYALRYADVMARTRSDLSNLWDFFQDEPRAAMEIAELKKNIKRVKVCDDLYEMASPLHPPWQDFGLWDDEQNDHGFGDIFRPEIDFSDEEDESSWATDVPDEEAEFEQESSHTKTALVSANGDTATGTDAPNAPDMHSEKATLNLPSAEWPALPRNQNKLQLPKQPTAEQPHKENPGNVWTAGQKKKFMNNGIAKGRKRLKFAPPTTTETDFLIDVDKAYSIKDVWGFSLLGQYVGRHPGHKAIKAMMDQWGVSSKYKIEEGWMIFSFDSEEDQEKVLIEGPYMIHGRPMLLKHVPDKFAFTNEDFATVPLWTRLYGLGSRFWTEDFLGGIASYVGKPLYLDPVTDSRKRNSYARVLVEVNLAEPVVRKVPLKFSDGDSFSCRIQLENEPKFCKHCCAFGHNIGECTFANPPAANKPLARQNLVASPPVEKDKNGPVNMLNSAAETSAKLSTLNVQQHVSAVPTVAAEADVSQNNNAAQNVYAMEKVDLQIQRTAECGGTESISDDKESADACPTVGSGNRFAVLVQDSGIMEKGDAQQSDACMAAGATKGLQNVSLVDGNDLATSTDMGEQRESLVAADRETTQSQSPPNLPQSTSFGTQASGRKRGSKV